MLNLMNEYVFESYLIILFFCLKHQSNLNYPVNEVHK